MSTPRTPPVSVGGDPRRHDNGSGHNLAQLTWLGRHALRLALAHGNRPGRAVGMLAVLAAVLAALFLLGPARTGVIRSTEDPAAISGAFSPFVYSLDTIIPIDFGEAASWQVDPTAPSARLYRGAVWVSIAAGWILSTLLVAAVATLSWSGGSNSSG